MKLTPYYLLALALIGIANTLYLSIAVYNGIFPSCSVGDCGAVLNSEYSKFFGVPLSYIGLAYYVYLLCLTTLLAWEPYSRALRTATLLYTGAGLLMSGVFVYIQGVLIGAFCQYCLISAATTVLLFGVALWHFVSARK